jgi:23S rRNA (guanosine2251-2'-O)-methyltransferase
MIIEGKNAVNEALKGNVTIEKLLIDKNGQSKGVYNIIQECRKRNIVIQAVEKAVLDKYSIEGRHQGVIAVATEYTYSGIDDILDADTGKSKLLILLDGVEDPHNLGAIIRVADCAGADGIIIPQRRNCGVTDTAVKVSCGASAYVKVAKVGNINDTIRDLKDRGIKVLAADMSGDSVYKTDLTGDIAFVIGGEGNGVHELTRKLCDGVVALPQNGKVNSLNASVAAGIVIYECLRQRG